MAVQMLDTEKPVTTPSTINTIRALITNRNSPKDSTVIGMVRIINSGFNKTFNSPKKAATKMALMIPVTSTPDIK